MAVQYSIMGKSMNELSGLGRRRAPDDRDRRYLLSRPRVPAAVTSKYWLSRGAVLDQGGTSQCVIYSADKWLTTHPVVNPGFTSAEERTRVYREVQRIDEWPGEEPDYDGTSVRAMFKYLKAKGFCTEYRWAFDLDTVVAHVLMTGPLVLGTSWTVHMFQPHDTNGYIWDTGEVVGGHAYLLHGVNRKKRNPDGTVGAGRIINSWGASWGSQKGKAWLTFDVLERLIQAEGEACMAVEVRT